MVTPVNASTLYKGQIKDLADEATDARLGSDVAAKAAQDALDTRLTTAEGEIVSDAADLASHEGATNPHSIDPAGIGAITQADLDAGQYVTHTDATTTDGKIQLGGAGSGADLKSSSSAIETVALADDGDIPTSAVVLAKTDEIQNDVALLQAQVNDPLPTATFDITVADNTLNARMGVLVGLPTYTHWKVPEDDDTVALAGDTDWITGAVDPAVPLNSDWGSHLRYLWVLDNATGTVTQIAPLGSKSDGEAVPGIWVQPRDTLEPVWGSSDFLTSAGTDDKTQIDLSITSPVDTGTGIDRLDLYNAVDDSLMLSSVVDGQTVSNLTPNTSYSWYLRAYDVAGNTSDSNSATLATADNVTNGTINLDAVAFEANQSTASMAIGLTRSGGSTGAVSVTVTTIDRTAIDGTNYTGRTAFTVNFADGATTPTVPLTVTLNAILVLTTNDMFEIQIDNGSESGGVSIGTIDSALCKILSSGSGVAGFQQESSGDKKAVVETSTSNATFTKSISDGFPDEAWEVQGSNNRVSPSGGSGNAIKPNSANGHLGWATGTVLDVRAPYGSYPINFTQTGTHELWLRGLRDSATTEDVHFAFENSVSSIGANDSGTSGNQLIILDEDHDFTVGDNIFFSGTAGYDSSPTTSRKFSITNLTANANEFEIANTSRGAEPSPAAICSGAPELLGVHQARKTTSPSISVAGWQWSKSNASGAARTFYVGAAGLHTMRLYVQDYQAQPDKFVVVPTSVGYDPTSVGTVGVETEDHYFGPDESTYSSGTIVDNPENPTSPTSPLPSSSMLPDFRSPSAGATNVSTVSLIVQAEFNGTGITVSSFDVSIGGTSLTGTVLSSTNTVQFIASGSQPENTLVTVTGSGTIRDFNNVLKSWSFTGTDWTFTTINTASSGTLFTQDFSSYSAKVGDYAYTNTDINADFNIDTLGYGDAWITGPSKDRTYIVDDPAPNGTHGKVLRVTQPGGWENIGQSISVACDFGTGTKYLDDGAQDVYFSYDMFISESHVFTKQEKLPGLFTGTRLEASHAGGVTPTPEGELAFVVIPSIYGKTAWYMVPYEAAMSVYFYDALVVQRDDFFDTVDPTISLYPNRQLSKTDPYQTTRGRWITFEQRVKMNTAGVSDGIIQMWVTDPSRWTGAKLVVDDQARRFKDAGATMSIDRFWLSTYYGGNPSIVENQLAITQYHYFDNIIVSTTPITH